MVLQQEVCHLCVAIVTCHMQWCITHLHDEGTQRERHRHESISRCKEGEKIEASCYNTTVSERTSCYVMNFQINVQEKGKDLLYLLQNCNIYVIYVCSA